VLRALLFVGNSVLTTLSVLNSNNYQTNGGYSWVMKAAILTNIVTYLFTLANLSWCIKHKMPFFFFREMYL